MITLRQTLMAACVMMAMVTAAQQTDPVISTIDNAYRQAQENIKKGKLQGNEMTCTLNYTMRASGKTKETLHFFYKTVQGSYAIAEDEKRHFYYFPLYLVTRSYNIGPKKYLEEFLFDTDTERLIYASMQDYDDNGKPFNRQFYYNDGSIYRVVGPEVSSPFMIEGVVYQAEELKHAFDWIIRNPKE